MKILCTGLILFSFSATLALAQKPASQDSGHYAAIADLIQAEAQFQQAREQRGMAGWLSFFAQNAINLAPGARITRGKPAMRKQLAASWNPNLRLTWQPEQVEVSNSGDMASTAGYWQLYDKQKANSPPIDTGKYLTVWRKQQNGAWKVIADIGNEDPGPAKKSGKPHPSPARKRTK